MYKSEKNSEKSFKTINTVCSEDIRKMTLNYLKSDYTQLPASWEYKNTPAYNKLYYLKKGRFHFEINGKAYEGLPGQMFLLPCYTEQAYHAYFDGTAMKYWLHFTVPCGSKDLFEMVTLPPFITVDDIEATDALFQKIVEISNTTDMEKIILQKSYCLQLLSIYIRESVFEPIRMVNDERILKVCKFIDEHLSEEIALSELAELVHFNPNYFVKYFKKMTGNSPMDYLLNRRIDKAKQLLQNETMPVKDIAFSLGFKTPDYFSHIFKARTGYTPTYYRTLAVKPPR